jgi:hypothetical protein
MNVDLPRHLAPNGMAMPGDDCLSGSRIKKAGLRRQVLAALVVKHRSELVPTPIELRPNLSVELRRVCHPRNTASSLMRVKTGEIAKLQSYRTRSTANLPGHGNYIRV